MEKNRIRERADEAVRLLTDLLRIPAVSREEEKKADFIEKYLRSCHHTVRREANNVWCLPARFREGCPTLLLNAHIDTVRPTAAWTYNPFDPVICEGRLYGLGSNDCGGGLVSLMQAFLLLADREEVPWNLVYLASAEEEVSGRNGVERVLPLLPPVDVAIVGEPTGMQPAVAEKGLMVLDVTARGKSGHAARDEGVNAIYEALSDVHWFRTYRFGRVSPLLGAVRMSLTMIQAGTQHNVVPDECRMVVDVRSNECYENREILDEIVRNVRSEVVPRSTRLNSSHIAADHPLVRRAVSLGGVPYGSPTLSDQALMPWPSLKLGPGDSARSHTADEYIGVDEVRGAVGYYCRLLMPDNPDETVFL